ncbi:NUDIX domain-containing protein [Sphingobacterium daejeonense]|uniref:NUDIX hydrolase n=1 Tax=Sphingobacterium daejeonense TaxID=371142 RepID=UPI0021A43FE4|nr:NUDIX domain-containing protein [Sphingobacterium daejeonense]MCT1529760.1 NUDIX domain-containing protein [Sphingobacterium daejeonense]
MKLNNYITIAVGIIINDRNELLTVQKKGSLYYQLPGGKIEVDEIPIESLIRELNEELNIHFTTADCQLIGVHEAQAVNEVGKTVKGYVFKCQYSEKLENLQPLAELNEVRWVKKSETTEVKLANLLRQFALPIWMGE